MKYQQQLIEFREELALLSLEVEAAVSMGHVDVAVICESVLCELLKHLYALPKLRNLNDAEKANFPAVDLADDTVRTAIQVTATTSLTKVKDTLTRFLDHSLDKRYKTLIICMLVNKQSRYSQSSIDKILGGRFEFEAAEHICDFQDLAKQASRVSPQVLSKSLAVLKSYTRRETVTPGIPAWEPIVFCKSRGLGPALLGRGLGPLDVGACPILQEVSTIVHQLEIAYSARISGAPGVGKSTCAYQVASELAKSGRRVYRLTDPGIAVAQLLNTIAGDPSVLIIDDAHLLPPGVLDYVEERADQTCYVLSTVNAVQTESVLRHVVSIDAAEAVKTIADGLRATPAETLQAVRLADDRVGEGYGDIQLADRIDEAARTSSYPWQFCFVLGGGWRRAKQAAQQVEQAGHGLALTAIALRQLASRDAVLSEDELFHLCEVIGMSKPDLADAIAWLCDRRLILSESDIRSPHQRFASVFLGELFARFKQDTRGEQFIALFRSVVTDVSMPMIGPYLVMDGIRFADSLRWQLPELLDQMSIDQVASRCWSAQEATDRSHAALVLNSLDDYVDTGIRSIIEPNKALLAKWISEASTTEGYGLARLMNDIWNDDEDFAREIVANVSATALADASSHVTTDTIYSVSELIDRLSLAADAQWKREYRDTLDKTQIRNMVSGWTENNRLFALGKYCYAISHYDEALALELVSAATPAIQRSFESNPIETFEQSGDLLGHLLRVSDPLGVYTGKLRPTGKMKRLARRFFQRIDAGRFAATLSSMPLRDFEPSARLISVVKDLSPTLFEATVDAVEWPAVEATLAGRWKKLPREATVFFCQITRPGDRDDCIATLLAKHADQIQLLDTRLAVAAPNVAFSVVENGQSVGLSRDMTFCWPLIAYLIHLFGEQRPDLLARLLAPHQSDLAEAFAKTQTNTFHHVDTLLQALADYAPETLDRILDEVSPDGAKTAWEACLRSDVKAQRAAAALVQAGINHGGELVAPALELRKRFPSKSIPVATAPISNDRAS